MKVCPSCREQVDDSVIYCPACGAEFERQVDEPREPDKPGYPKGENWGSAGGQRGNQREQNQPSRQTPPGRDAESRTYQQSTDPGRTHESTDPGRTHESTGSGRSHRTQPSHQPTGPEPDQQSPNAEQPRQPLESERSQEPVDRGRNRHSDSSTNARRAASPETTKETGLGPETGLFGFVFGLFAHVIGYIITFLLVIGVEADDIEDAEEELVELVGWLYYNAQFVDIGSSAGSETFNYFDQNAFVELLEVPVIGYRLIPVAVLFLAGLAAGLASGVRSPERGAVAGATVALGASVFAIGGTVLFEISEAGEAAGPELGTSIALVGIGFPLVFGAVGGAVASAFQD